MNIIRIIALATVLVLMTSCGERQIHVSGHQSNLAFASGSQQPIQSVAGMSMEHMFGDWSLIQHYPLIVVAKVIHVHRPGGETNGAPPQLTLTVRRVLKGKCKLGRTQAIWRAFPHDVDWSGDGALEAIQVWESLPNPPPTTGSEWILCGSIENDVFGIAPRCRYASTRGNIEWVRSVLRDKATADGPPDTSDPVRISPHPIRAFVPR